MERKPRRGEVWLADLGETTGHEQEGERPFLIVSSDLLNQTRASMVIGIPATTTIKNLYQRVRVHPPEGGVRRDCEFQPDQIRAISFDRLINRWGKVSHRTLALVEHSLRMLLEL